MRRLCGAPVFIAATAATLLWVQAEASEPCYRVGWDDPLEFAHLVVVGEIEDFYKIDTTLDEWRTAPGQDLESMHHEVQGVVLGNVECLRGHTDGRTTTVFYWQTGTTTRIGLDSRLSVGDRVLFAARYVPESARYLLSGSSAVYVENGRGFRRLSDSALVDPDELRRSVARADPRSLYEDAELVVWGCVDSVSRENGFDRYEIDVSRVFKGAAPGASLSLKLPMGFCPFPEYKVPAPEGVAAGDSVFAFAGTAPFGPWVLKGRNGLLPTRDGFLRRGYARHELSKAELWSALSRGTK